MYAGCPKDKVTPCATVTAVSKKTLLPLLCVTVTVPVIPDPVTVSPALIKVRPDDVIGIVVLFVCAIDTVAVCRLVGVSQVFAAPAKPPIAVVSKISESLAFRPY